jgi:DNA polymerase-1
VAPGHGKAGETVYDQIAVVERHKVRPVQIPHLKALMGDPGDCIPGVDGVGEVTATKLIQAYGDLEAVLKAAEDPAAFEAFSGPWPVPERHRQAILVQQDLARTCLKLATIDVQARLVALPRAPDERAVRDALLRYRLRSLMTASGMAALMQDADGGGA